MAVRSSMSGNRGRNPQKKSLQRFFSSPSCSCAGNGFQRRKRADPSHVFREAKGCFQSYENICACSFSKEPGKARARSIQGKPVRIGGNLREYKSLKELENINAASCAENFSAITPFLISIAQIRRGRIISFDLLWTRAEIQGKAKARSASGSRPLSDVRGQLGSQTPAKGWWRQRAVARPFITEQASRACPFAEKEGQGSGQMTSFSPQAKKKPEQSGLCSSVT